MMVATSESKGEHAIPISVVQCILLLHLLFVPKKVHVDQIWVIVKVMTSASQETVDQRIVLLYKAVLNVLISYQLLIVVKVHIIIYSLFSNMNICQNLARLSSEFWQNLNRFSQDSHQCSNIVYIF